MIIVMRKNAPPAEVESVMAAITAKGLKPLYLPGVEKIVIGAIGDERVLAELELESLPCVDRVMPVLAPYKLAGRESQPGRTVIPVGGVRIGEGRPVIMAGPCAVESREQLLASARAVKSAGAQILRGGAYKPRTSPYSFQGLEEEGLSLLEEARAETGLPIVTEVLDPHDLPAVERTADILQIGARNMQNFRLLREVGKTRKPVMLKRGMSATVDELLMSAEYVLAGGNEQVILCERGIKTFSTDTRNTLDLSVVPLLHQKTHLPIVVDPSHATGLRNLVEPMALAALACGAHGLMVEVHAHPESAKCDGMQQLTPDQFASFMEKAARLVAALAPPARLPK